MRYRLEVTVQQIAYARKHLAIYSVQIWAELSERKDDLQLNQQKWSKNQTFENKRYFPDITGASGGKPATWLTSLDC